MTQASTPSSAAPPSIASQGRPQASSQPQGAGPAIQRQFVSFAYFKLDPAFRRLNDHEKFQARSEFLKFFQTPRPGLLCLTYSTIGLKQGVDFLLWRISLTPDDFQAQDQLINKSRLGAYLTMPASYLSMTKRSMYI